MVNKNVRSRYSCNVTIYSWVILMVYSLDSRLIKILSAHMTRNSVVIIRYSVDALSHHICLLLVWVWDRDKMCGRKKNKMLGRLSPLLLVNFTESFSCAVWNFFACHDSHISHPISLQFFSSLYVHNHRFII